MASHDQVLRFAVGKADGPRSRTWRLWVPKSKSDVYVSGRTLGHAIKVSLHEPGPARFALTKQWVRKTGFSAPAGKDARLAVEWDRPRPHPPKRIARPLSILVPFDEVQQRHTVEDGSVVWVASPGHGECVHFDIVYVPSVADVTSHPGARSMGTKLVGRLTLENGQHVFVTSIARPIQVPLQGQILRLRTAPVLDKHDRPIRNTGMLAFGTEPNADANDGTFVGVLLDITRKATPTSEGG